MILIPDSMDPANQAETIAAANDARVSTSPICKDCGNHITSERCLPINEYGIVEYVCERCADRRMIWTDELEVN